MTQGSLTPREEGTFDTMERPVLAAEILVDEVQATANRLESENKILSEKLKVVEDHYAVALDMLMKYIGCTIEEATQYINEEYESTKKQPELI